MAAKQTVDENYRLSMQSSQEKPLDKTPPKAIISWSSGKDCAYALYECRRLGIADIVGVLTTVNEPFDRVAMHGVRRSVLAAQMNALDLPCIEVPLPYPCSNEIYAELMGEAVAAIKAQGIRHMVFGDLFLEDIRHYREDQLQAVGMTPLFPLWERETRALAEAMIASGLEAHIACVDPKQLDPEFAGRAFSPDLLDDLPKDVDPCGENGEFHTLVTGSPIFSSNIDIVPGEVVTRDGFVFADFKLV